jgi:hypothetical protein
VAGPLAGRAGPLCLAGPLAGRAGLWLAGRAAPDRAAPMLHTCPALWPARAGLAPAGRKAKDPDDVDAWTVGPDGRMAGWSGPLCLAGPLAGRAGLLAGRASGIVFYIGPGPPRSAPERPGAPQRYISFVWPGRPDGPLAGRPGRPIGWPGPGRAHIIIPSWPDRPRPDGRPGLYAWPALWPAGPGRAGPLAGRPSGRPGRAFSWPALWPAGPGL